MNQDFWDLIKSGDETAYAELYNNYADQLYSYGMKIIPNDELVSELIQSLFVNIYERRNFLSYPISIKAYLFSSLKRMLIRAENRKNNNISFDEIENIHHHFKLELDVEAALIKQQYEECFLHYIQSLLDSLSPRQRESIYLKYYKNHSNEEIADILEISNQAVRNLIYKALCRMRSLQPKNNNIISHTQHHK